MSPAPPCPRCGAVSSADEAVCARCGEVLLGPTAAPVEDPSARLTAPSGPPAALSAPLDVTVSSSAGRSGEAEVLEVEEVPSLDGYELVELLGKGGMGEVWKARQLSLGRVVALKLLPQRFAQDPDFVARFDKEASALAAVSHPHIVQIFDRGRTRAHYYFAMELVTGGSLRDVLARGPVEAPRAVRLALEVARGMEAAHEAGVVHRDLKPENILLDRHGHVKVVDFGLAGLQGHQAGAPLTGTAVAMGTVNYMAPEQRRDARSVDGRADLYSLGVILYELLTGTLPVGRFKLPSQRAPGIDVALDALVGRLLEPEPADRPASALQVAQALEPLLTPSQLSRPAEPGSSPARRSLLGGLASLGVALLAALVLWPRSAPAPAPVVTSAPAWYADSEDELFAGREVTAGRVLSLHFDEAGPAEGEELNTHAGVWALRQGALEAVQYGEPTDPQVVALVPRAYVAHRYFAADDFDAEVHLGIRPLEGFPPLEPEDQRFAELAFRIKDLQVSVFAIPDVGLRLLWRYYRPDGTEVVGNSARDEEELLEDEVRVPTSDFTVRLILRRLPSGAVNAEAFVNGRRFARKVLPGLGGQVGKVALGCRNLSCRFDELVVSGAHVPRPAPRTTPR